MVTYNHYNYKDNRFNSYNYTRYLCNCLVAKAIILVYKLKKITLIFYNQRYLMLSHSILRTIYKL